jgi:hypothetical protein
MAELDGQSDWLAVIGKSLAYLCLSRAMEREPGKYDSVLKKVEFLVGLGLPRDAAAQAREARPPPSLSFTGRIERRRMPQKTQRRRKSRKPSAPDADVAAEFPTAEKIARLLAIIAVKGLDNEEAARRVARRWLRRQADRWNPRCQPQFRQRG